MPVSVLPLPKWVVDLGAWGDLRRGQEAEFEHQRFCFVFVRLNLCSQSEDDLQDGQEKYQEDEKERISDATLMAWNLYI